MVESPATTLGPGFPLFYFRQYKSVQCITEEQSVNGVTNNVTPLTLPMLRLISSKAQKHIQKNSNTILTLSCWYSLVEYSQMSINVAGFRSFFRFLHTFVLAKLATSSIRFRSVVQTYNS